MGICRLNHGNIRRSVTANQVSTPGQIQIQLAIQERYPVSLVEILQARFSFHGKDDLDVFARVLCPEILTLWIDIPDQLLDHVHERLRLCGRDRAVDILPGNGGLAELELQA